MSKTLKINPVTRVEGHLEIDVTVESVDGHDQVIDARAASTMFRGFEIILSGRDPRDAVHLTQRICGVCPVSHAMASSLALEDAFKVPPTDNGRIARNLVLAANYIQSHVLHFYHLAAPDYIDTTGILDMSPWKPRYEAPDMVGGQAASQLVGHYVEALAIRRKAQQMGALFGGRLPGVTSFVPGGTSEVFTADHVSSFRTLLDEIRLFIDDTFIPDVNAVAALFPAYITLGRGPGNFLAYGVFDLDSTGTTKLQPRGRYTAGAPGTVDPTQIREDVGHSWFEATSGGLHPSDGMTEPSPDKEEAYSWVKAPRYGGTVHEVGPLARMWVSGDYDRGISVVDRLAARALETKKIADAMGGWLDELEVDAPVYTHKRTPEVATGVGLTEAPRGALGHWVEILDEVISRYQVVTPTAWNASPRDDLGNLGAIEQALIGTPVESMENPVEVLRVVHSFDPCLACSVHTVRPGERSKKPTVSSKTGQDSQ